MLTRKEVMKKEARNLRKAVRNLQDDIVPADAPGEKAVAYLVGARQALNMAEELLFLAEINVEDRTESGEGILRCW